MSGRALQKSRKLPCLHTSVQYLDKKGLHLIMARVVCLNRGRERCMCVSEERKEVGTRRKEPAVLNSTAPPHHHVVFIRMAFPSPEHPNQSGCWERIRIHMAWSLGFQRELWGKFLSPSLPTSESGAWVSIPPGSLLFECWWDQGQSFSGNPWVSGLTDSNPDVKPHT